MNSVKYIFASLAMLVAITPANAGMSFHGTPASSAPVLQAVAVNFGQNTPAGRGAVYLHTQDVATNAADTVIPVTQYGLDLLASGSEPCATFTTTFNSGRSSTDFSLATDAAYPTGDGSPTVTGTGSGHITGTYVFNVSCKDASGNSSNTTTLTYTTVANAVNLGPLDPNYSNVPTASYGLTTGWKLLLSTGYQKATATDFTASCPTLGNCEMTWANSDRPGGITCMKVGTGGTGKTNFHDIIFSGVPTGASCGGNYGIYVSGSSSGSNTFNNITMAYPKSDIVATGNVISGIRSDAGGTTITNTQIYNVSIGVAFFGDDMSVSNLSIGHFSGNALDMGNSHRVTMRDVTTFAAEQAGALHVDCFQIENGATPSDLDIDRFVCAQAGGQAYTQAPIFPGHNSLGAGYIDDGTSGHGPGHIATMTSWIEQPTAGPFYTPCTTQTSCGESASNFWSPGYIAGADGVTVASFTGAVATLVGLTDTNIGSVSSPVPMGSFLNNNFNIRNIVFTGSTPNGYIVSSQNGTDVFSNFAYAFQNPSVPYATLATGTVSGTTVTINCATVTTSLGAANATAAIYSGGSGTGFGIYSGSTLLGTLTSQTSGPANCRGGTGTAVYVLSASGGTIGSTQFSFVAPVGPATANSNAQIYQNCTAPYSWAYTGTSTYSQGFSSTGIGQVGGTCATTTVTKVWTNTTAPPASNFANGDPETYLEGISITDWNAKTPTGVLASVCHALLPKVGGSFDNGDGTFASPFKLVAGAGQWSDGTAITGCN